MQRRSLLLILLAAGALATLLLLRWGPRGTPALTPGKARTADSARVSADLVAPLGASVERVRVSPAFWDVIVSDAAGQLMTEARVRASCGAVELEGRGGASWTGLQPGVYRLEVEAEGLPKWSSECELAPGAHERTLVRLGLTCPISGRLRDTRGVTLRDHLVLFLRPGERAPEVAGELQSTLHGTTAGDGSFDVVLPGEGSWRPVVVFGGQIVFDAAAHTLVTREGPRRADLTVQASTRLTLTVEDVSLGTHAAAISVYRRATPLELARQEALRRKMADLAAAGEIDEPSDDPVAAEERARSLSEEDSPALRAQIERQRHWRTVVPDGWINVKSSVMPESRRVVFERLTHETQLRLGVRRGDEVLRVEPPLVLALGEDQHATITLPPPNPADAAPLDDLRVAPIVVTSTPAPGAAVPGVRWE